MHSFVQYQNNNRKLDSGEKAEQERIELEEQKTAEETRKKINEYLYWDVWLSQ